MNKCDEIGFVTEEKPKEKMPWWKLHILYVGVLSVLLMMVGFAQCYLVYHDPGNYLGIKPKVDFWTYLWIHVQIHNTKYMIGVILFFVGLIILRWPRK